MPEMIGHIEPWSIRVAGKHQAHLVYRSKNICYLESYIPSRFARQFGYDQLYVGNLNTNLAFMGSLFDDA